MIVSAIGAGKAPTGDLGDMKPYYDKLDSFVGIFGTNHAAQTGLHNEPDGKFQPPPLPRAYELYFKQSADRLGITCVPSRLSRYATPAAPVEMFRQWTWTPVSGPKRVTPGVSGSVVAVT